MVHELPYCASSVTEHLSEPGLMHSMPEHPRMWSWSRWPTSSRGSRGPCCRVDKTIDPQQIRLPYEIVWKGRLRLGSADALPLSHTTTTTSDFYPPRSAQEQQGRQNSHNLGNHLKAAIDYHFKSGHIETA